MGISLAHSRSDRAKALERLGFAISEFRETKMAL